MEVFTFVQIGGDRQRITLIELGRGMQIAKFDAAKAECFLARDRHKLLAVIEYGFGDLRPFNRIVRKLLAKQMEMATSNTGLPSAMEVTVSRV